MNREKWVRSPESSKRSAFAVLERRHPFLDPWFHDSDLADGKTYTNRPPIPERAVGHSGTAVFKGEGIRAGQELFLKGEADV